METSNLKIRSRLTPSHQLPITTLDKAEFERQLKATIEQAPALFQRAPVILDLSLLEESIETDQLHDLLIIGHNNLLVPFALTSLNSNHQALADSLGLAWLDFKAGAAKKQATPAAIPITETQVITTPVRSGQQVYAKDAHLLVMNQVSAGAEVIADGNIHIFGTLRGKAIAGAQGNIHSEIICSQMEAELLAIAGTYLLQENFPTGEGRARCRLDSDHIVINYL